MSESEAMNFDAATYTAQGTERERVQLPGDLFDGTVNMPVMHQAVKAFLAGLSLDPWAEYASTRQSISESMRNANWSASLRMFLARSNLVSRMWSPAVQPALEPSAAASGSCGRWPRVGAAHSLNCSAAVF